MLSLFLVICLFFPHNARAEKTHKILVLHSYHKGLSWTDSLVDGIESGFAKSGLSVEFSHEFMDTKRLFSPRYLAGFADLYRLKYENSPVDLIISTDDYAFSFLLKHQKNLFPQTPVVFCGVNNFQPEMLNRHPLFTGVVETYDIVGSLGGIFEIHPETKRLVVISDQTLTGQTNRKLFVEATKSLARPVEYIFLDNHTMAEVKNAVSQLSRGDVAFWLSFSTDRNGEYFSFRESGGGISRVSAVPLYSLWDFHLGHGIVGGKLASGIFQGEKASEMAVQLLKGVSASDLPVITKDSSRYMFDFGEMSRWGISKEMLPSGSLIVNEPITLYSQYKNFVWFAIILLITLVSIIVLLFLNIVQRKRAGRAITRARDHFQKIFNDTTVALFEVDVSLLFQNREKLVACLENDVDTLAQCLEKAQINLTDLVTVIDCNKAALQLFGGDSKSDFLQIAGRGFPLFDVENVGKVLGSIFQAETHVEWEVTWRRGDGNSRHILLGMQGHDENAEEQKCIISAVDITKRKKYLSELRQSEERFRILYNCAASGIALLDRDGNYLRANQALCQMLGYESEELERMNWRTVTYPEDIGQTEKYIEDRFDNGQVSSFEKRWIRKDGSVVWGILNIGRNIDSTGQTEYYIAQIIDVTEKKSTQAKMRLKDERYRQIFEAELTGFYIANPSGKILLCNKVFAQMVGFGSVAELVGRNVSPFYRKPDEWISVVHDLTEGNRLENREIELLTTDGESIIVLSNGIGRFSESGSLLEVQGHMMDISHQKKLEDQLVRAQKMEAIGLMAGGVAHDLNNILSGIINYPELILARMDENNEMRKPLVAIKESGQRAAAVVADLLTVARRAANVREVCSLKSLVLEYINSPECESLQALYPEIQIEFEAQEKEMYMLCSPVHIKKCLMNLVTNGAEAIEGEGVVKIAISNKEMFDIVGHREKNIDYLILTVSDDGPGIGAADQEYIFEPFYTKKVMGRSGTGLGLAVVWNSVQDHEGKIQVESNEKGTTFTLYFPRHERPLPEQPQDNTLISVQGNNEYILVVDDEPVLRDIACQMLTGLGYRVDTVDNGEAALLFLRTQTVDLVILDMYMDPGINGCETYERIIGLFPDQKALITSGYSKSDDVKKALRLGVGSFLEKPYSTEQLSRAVVAELKRSR